MTESSFLGQLYLLKIFVQLKTLDLDQCLTKVQNGLKQNHHLSSEDTKEINDNNEGQMTHWNAKSEH